MSSDTVEWIHRNRLGRDGKVGTSGSLLLASDRWLTAALGTPLDAMGPSAVAASF